MPTCIMIGVILSCSTGPGGDYLFPQARSNQVQAAPTARVLMSNADFAYLKHCIALPLSDPEKNKCFRYFGMMP